MQTLARSAEERCEGILRTVSRTPVWKSIADEATAAAYSPDEWPRKKEASADTGVENSCSSVRRKAMEVMRMAGWALEDRVSSS